MHYGACSGTLTTGEHELCEHAMKGHCALDEIRTEIQRRIARNWANGFCRDCTAPEPYRIPHDGISNWTVALAAKPGCEGFMLDIIAAVRDKCELKPETLSEAVERLLVWDGWISWKKRRNQD
jgi:hypothetical protein